MSRDSRDALVWIHSLSDHGDESVKGYEEII